MCIKKYGWSILLFIFSCAAIVAITDWFIQWRYPIPGKGYLSIVSKPPGSNLRLIIEPDNFEAVHRYNRFGSRGADFSISPRTDLRVAILGDSFTEGIGAQEDETWPFRLFQEFSDLNLEVLNLGKGGDSASGYARVLAQIALPLKPTDAIVCFMTNDFLEVFDVPEGLEPRTHFDNPFIEQRRGLLKPIARFLPGWMFMIDHTIKKSWEIPQTGLFWRPYDESLTELAVEQLTDSEEIQESEARQIILKRMDAVEAKVMEASRQRKFNASAVWHEIAQPGYSYRVRLQDMKNAPEPLFDAVKEWLLWYKQTCEQFDIRPWVVYFPQAPLVSDRPYGIWPDQHSIHKKGEEVFGDTSVRDLLKEGCQLTDIPFIDATNILLEYKEEPLFLRYDTHPTPRAYQLVGKIVADGMRSEFVNIHR